MKDEVEGIIRLLESDISEPVNIGNPSEMTVRQLAELVLELTGSDSTIIQKELPVDDPRVRQPNITKARQLLKWEPQVPIREGLQRTIEYFKKVLNV